MAITTFSELNTALLDRIGRADFTAAQQAEMVAFTEARMQRMLRTTDMECLVANLNVEEYTDFPPGFLGVRTFHLESDPRRLLLPERDYVITAGKFYFPDVTNLSTRAASLVYFSKIPALSSSNTQNWLLTAHPDAYLYGVLMEASIRVKDPQAVDGYKFMFEEAVRAISKHANTNRYSGQGMAVRVE